MQTLVRHKLILIVIILIVGGGIWYIMSGGGGSSESLITQTPIATAGADQELVSTLLALRAVKLDGTIFSEPAFLNLKDFSTQIIPETVGRPNPFAPLSAGASNSASSTRAAQLFTPAR